MDANMDPSCIVLLHSIPEFVSQIGRPAKKWDSKAFAAMGDVVASTVPLANWEPRYMKLLLQLLNIPSQAMIDTAQESTPLPILLDPVVYSNAGATAMQVHRTSYVLLLLVLILL